jgi:hypothetical protein
MRIRGIHYDVGIDTIDGKVTRPELPRDQVAAELNLIAQDLHSNAVRISGKDAGRMALAAELAAERGLDVWLSPFLSNGTPEDTLVLLRESAELGERLRQDGLPVTLIVGLEMSGFLKGIIPGEGVLDRLNLLMDPARLIAAVTALGQDPQKTMASFLEEAADTARSHFGGAVTYGAGLWEQIDWSLFDIVGVDAYRDIHNRAGFDSQLRAYLVHGKPVVVTEFGCATFHGAADQGSMAWTVAERGATPTRLKAGTRRDESEQARELVELMRAYDAAGMEGGFIYTLVAPSYASNPLPRLDLDTASYSLIRTWDDGRTEQKLAFQAVGSYYRSS